MASRGQYQEKVRLIAEEALSLFHKIAEGAKDRLRGHAPGVGANMPGGGVRSYNRMVAISRNVREACELLSREPVIARVIARDESGKEEIYYISRVAAPIIPNKEVKIVSQRAPLGGLAARRVGEELELSDDYLKVINRSLFNPAKEGEKWDSKNSILQGETYGPITVNSLRKFLERYVEADSDADLPDEEGEKNIREGIRRTIITKAQLRDQPVLDRFQDDIFRLPLNSQLLIKGPPGSGKTTTLIRRLGLKLDKRHFSPSEERMVEDSQYGGALEHKINWIMFTPTELLKKYLKESFAREGIAASDLQVKTWTIYRRELARNTFGVLRTSSGGGFVMNESVGTIHNDTIPHQPEWFEDFQSWQENYFWEDLRRAADALGENESDAASKVGVKLMHAVNKYPEQTSALILGELEELRSDIRKVISENDPRNLIERGMNLQINRDSNFLDNLAEYVGRLSEADDDQEEEDEQSTENVPQSGVSQKSIARRAYRAAVSAQARAEFTKRSLRAASRSGKIVAWLGNRSLDRDALYTLGGRLEVRSATQKFLNPLSGYLNGIPRRYRTFRRIRQGEEMWYRKESYARDDINCLEVDIILLSMIRAAKQMRTESTIEDSLLENIPDLSWNQVMVDEATDFSPIQLACMREISNPKIKSLFACGDFNQRITAWGSRSEEDVRWAVPDIEIRSIKTVYRHSKELNEFAGHIADSPREDAVLPEDVDSGGQPIAFAKNLHNAEMIGDWISRRVQEIESITESLPSVAVLVNREEDVDPIAKATEIFLSEKNINVVPCFQGEFSGQDSDVRVFDIQHIKGLEFEAVFFVGIDTLAEKNPNLFDKYLYVGATRAAMYLGLICEGDALPEKIAALESSFVASWN